MAAHTRKIRGVNRLTEDCDYLHTLPEAEREWMHNFLRAWSDCTGPMVEEVGRGFRWATNGRNEGKALGEETGRKALNRKHHAVRSDVYTHMYGKIHSINEEKGRGSFPGEHDDED